MRRDNKSLYFVLVIVVLFCISIGYAVINRTLTINGNSLVKENSWDIYFDNVLVKNGSVEADSLPVIDTTTKSTVSFNVMLDLPGDFYEFRVNIKNAGSIDAMIDSIIKTPELTASQAKYLNYIIEYENEEQITSKQLVKAGEEVRLKVRVEYRTDLNEEDLPSVTETLNLGFLVNYVQADASGISVKDNGAWKIEANGSLDDIGTIVTIGSEQFYTIGTEGNNVKLLSMYNLYVGNVCTDTSSSSCTEYGQDATGMQKENMKGANLDDAIRRGTVRFSNSGTAYSGSIVQGYVNNYKNLLENKFNIEITEARLITVDELTDSNTFNCEKKGYCDSIYSWIYLTSYWTMSAVDSELLWIMRYYGALGDNRYGDYTYFGVRPVIVIPKSTIIGEKEIFNIIIAGNTYQAEEGMTWEEWIESDYNLVRARKEATSSSSSYIFNGDLCEVLSYKGTGTMIFSDELIDKNKEYYFRGVSYCK